MLSSTPFIVFRVTHTIGKWSNWMVGISILNNIFLLHTIMEKCQLKHPDVLVHFKKSLMLAISTKSTSNGH